MSLAEIRLQEGESLENVALSRAALVGYCGGYTVSPHFQCSCREFISDTRPRRSSVMERSHSDMARRSLQDLRTRE
jgi:hypothetical protein